VERREVFPRSYRLRKDREFEKVFREGTVIRRDFLLIHALPNHLPHPRLGIRVPGKISPAPRRNRIKRWIREGFRRHAQAIGGYDLVVRVNPQSPPSTFAEVEGIFSELASLLKKNFPSSNPEE
jgi:ribonuclease P protein component